MNITKLEGILKSKPKEERRIFTQTKQTPISIKRENPADLIKTHIENTAKMDLFFQTVEETEKDFKDKGWKLKKLADNEIDVIEKWKRDEQNILDDKLKSIQEEQKKQKEKLHQDVTKLNRLIYFLQKKNEKLEINYSEISASQAHRGNTIKKLDTYQDDNLILHTYLTQNDRPVNNRSLVIIGLCRFGTHEYQTMAREILELKDDWGIGIECYGSGCNIKFDVNVFPNDEDAISHSKQGIKSIMYKFFRDYNKVVAEYEIVNKTYSLKDFADFIKKQEKKK